MACRKTHVVKQQFATVNYGPFSLLGFLGSGRPYVRAYLAYWINGA